MQRNRKRERSAEKEIGDRICLDPDLDPTTEAALLVAAQGGCRVAESRLMRHFGHLILSVAKRYKWSGMELWDLFSEGCIGFKKAVQRFDPDRGAVLATYAFWWIRASIRIAIKNCGRTIRLPSQRFEHVTKVRRMIREHGTEDVDELSRLTDLPADRIRTVLQERHETECTSLDHPFYFEHGTLHDIVSDRSAPDQEAMCIRKDSASNVWHALRELDLRSRAIACCRHMDGMTLDETADFLHEELGLRRVSRERTRQLQQQIDKRLRFALGIQAPHK